MSDPLVKKSEIHEKGIFAARDFKKGETVLKWHPKPIKRGEIENLKKEELHHVIQLGNSYYLMNEPERYVNHSCGANTEPVGKSDVAVRDIAKGEEITSDYSLVKGFETFRCLCGNRKCKKIIS